MKVFIDAGHNYSGFDTGASGNGLREQDITYDIAVKLSTILKNCGFDVKCSRNAKTENLGFSLSNSLFARYNAANNWNADYFISLHCNAGGGVGAETLIYKMGTQAEKLARSIQGELVGFGFKDRGLKIRPELSVLKNTNMPAALVEMGFIDNPGDAAKMKNEQDGIAVAIAKGICSFCGINFKPIGGESMNNKVTDVNEAITIIKEKTGISDETIQFLLCYKYGEELLKKLAKGMK